MSRIRSVLTFIFGALLLVGAMLALTADLFTVEKYDAISCTVANRDSVYGDSTWSWLPPGKVCHYPDGSHDRPHWRGESLALLAIPIGAGLVVRSLALRGPR